MAVPFLDLHAQYRSIQSEIDDGIARVIRNSTFAGGPEVAAFEKEFAAYCGASHCVGLSSGTAALELILRAYGIGTGDEVIIPANTFFATAEAIIMTGATPVLVDALEDSGLIDPLKIAKVITKKTKAIVPVHLFGQPAHMDEILAIARPKKLIVIEDSCQAHGATYTSAGSRAIDEGRPATQRTGSLADAAAFSFYPGKNLGAFGDAGAVTTGDAAIADTIRLFREHGMRKKYEHEIVGRTERMDGMQAAVLRAKLPHLDEWNAQRRKIAARYREALASMNVRMMHDDNGVVHLFVIRVAHRDRVREKMREQGIDTGIHYPYPLHLIPPLKSLGYKKGDFPVSEALAGDILSLPMFPELTDAQQDSVLEALKKVL